MTDDNTPDVEEEVKSDPAPEPEAVDVSVYEAKISELNGVIETLNSTIVQLNAEVDRAKAVNYDLMMNGTPTDGDITNGDIDPEGDPLDVDIDDLFESKD